MSRPARVAAILLALLMIAAIIVATWQIVAHIDQLRRRQRSTHPAIGSKGQTLAAVRVVPKGERSQRTIHWRRTAAG